MFPPPSPLSPSFSASGKGNGAGVKAAPRDPRPLPSPPFPDAEEPPSGGKPHEVSQGMIDGPGGRGFGGWAPPLQRPGWPPPPFPREEGALWPRPRSLRWGSLIHASFPLAPPQTRMVWGTPWEKRMRLLWPRPFLSSNRVFACAPF